MWKYMYVDESGDLGQNGSRNLVIAALTVDDYVPLDRIIKRVRTRGKFTGELKGVQEIKGYKSDPALVRHLICKLNEVPGIQCSLIVLDKRRIYSTFLKEHKDKLYNYVAGKLAEFIILKGRKVDVRIDRSKRKQLLQDDFNQYFRNKLQFGTMIQEIKIAHSWSHSWSGLQFADILAWSKFQQDERGNSEFVGLIKFETEVNTMWKSGTEP